MEQRNHDSDKRGGDIDGLDALFDAAGSWRPGDAPKNNAEQAAPAKDSHDSSRRTKRESAVTRPARTAPAADGDSVIPEADLLALTGETDFNSDEKYVAVDPGRTKTSAPTLVPARVHAYIPLWGWMTIIMGLIVFVAAVIILPGISIDRLASRLGDESDAVVQQAMRALVVKGDVRTVRKLFDMASSEDQGIRARLRAVDTMSMIEDVPEVDRSLLRLELTENTHDQIREAAIAARRQREASRARGQR